MLSEAFVVILSIYYREPHRLNIVMATAFYKRVLRGYYVWSCVS